MSADEPVYDFGDDVGRYLKDKGLTIADLTKKHKRNVKDASADDEHLNEDDNEPPFPDTQTIKEPYATPIVKKPEKWLRDKPTVDSDWSKVLQADPNLPNYDVSGTSIRKKKKPTAAKRKTKVIGRQITKAKSVVAKEDVAKVKARTKAYGSAAGKEKKSKVSGMTKTEKSTLAKLTGTAAAGNDLKFIPKKTPDDEVLAILEGVLGAQHGRDVVREAVETSAFFSADPVTNAKLRAIATGQKGLSSQSDKAKSEERHMTPPDAKMQSGVVAAADGREQKPVQTAQTLNTRLDAMVRKINTKNELAVPGTDGQTTTTKKATKKSHNTNPDADAVKRKSTATCAEDIAIRASEAGTNGMDYVQIEAVLAPEDMPQPSLSPYLIEAFSYKTTLVFPTMEHSMTLHRPIVAPYGLDAATGPAYREEPPSTISYGGPAPPLESRKVRPITDTSPQIQDPINHVIKTPWEDVLADRRTVATPCKRTTVLQKDFVPSDVDLGLDDIETVDPATIALSTEPEKSPDAETAEKDEEEETFNISNTSAMKNNVAAPEIPSEPIDQGIIDVQDDPPKGLVQELTAAIVNQLKAEGILAGGNGGGLSNGGGGSGQMLTPELLSLLMSQQAIMQPGMQTQDGMAQNMSNAQNSTDPNAINLGDRHVPVPLTTLGSALLTARVAGMSYDNQAPLRGIKTATMNPYRPVVKEAAKANVWQSRGKPGLGPKGGAPPPVPGQSLAGTGETFIMPSQASGSVAVAQDGSRAGGPDTLSMADRIGSTVRSTANANASPASGDDFHLAQVAGNEEEVRANISDEEPALSAEQQKDLFTKCLNNRSRQVEELFALGIPVDTTDEHGNTCLHVACQCGSKRMVKACLRWGADLNKQNKQGQTALHYCFAYKYEQLAAYLISKGATDTIVNNFGLTCYDGLKPGDEDGSPPGP